MGHISGSSYSGRVREYSVKSDYATAIFVGDAVSLTGAANTDGVGNVDIAAAGEIITGICVGIKVDAAVAATVHPGYLPASTGGTIFVNDDPGALFEVQEDSVGGAAGVVAVGNVFNHTVATAGDTTTGMSGHELDSSDVGTGTGFVIVEASRRLDNEPANTSAKFIVKINEHSYGSDAAGV
jgi:hypothetical protein